jgi:hypothetical protein
LVSGEVLENVGETKREMLKGVKRGLTGWVEKRERQEIESSRTSEESKGGDDGE